MTKPPSPINPANPGVLLRAGWTEEAIRIYQQIARASPRRPDAHNNLAVALKAAGRLEEAVQNYHRAVKIDPAYDVARKNLARALRRMGRHEDALAQFATVFRGNSEDTDARFEIIDTLSEMEFPKPSPVARKLLLELFQRQDMDPQRLAPATFRLLMTNRRFATAIAAAVEAYPDQEPDRPLANRDLADPLLISLLTWTLTPSPEMEAWITMARRQLLMAKISEKAISVEPVLLWAMAAHCHASEHAQSITSDENAIAASLVERLQPGDETGIAIAGMYLPLATIPPAHDLWRRVSATKATATPMRLLLDRAIANPRIERDIAASLTSLTPIKNETSTAVRAQYEANPYPKWLSTDRGATPRTLGQRLTQRFPALITTGLNLERPRILVAGCGTGRHAITTAARYKDCSVLAVDISRTSLAYASRQANLLGQDNIEFAQADILGLATQEERFDLIECSGVLHHMADPMAGWRALRKRTARHGVMRIGLYSRHARSRWQSLSGPVPSDIENDEINDFLRRRRAMLLAKRPDGPEAVVFRIGDFYSLSGCRDLLFHTREVQFTLLEISAALTELNLEFLGFDALPGTITEEFRKRFPTPHQERDLSAWDTFEQDNPDTFIAMYQFWCQAKS
jgi:SAM-dependent methyltransferase/tetratricopeptide (TPR) repeat protein